MTLAPNALATALERFRLATSVVVLGNSFGCQVAVELAVRHPRRVGGLVLVGPTIAALAAPAGRDGRQATRGPPT